MTGTNAESFSAPSFMTPFSLACRSRLIHLCNRFAFTPCESARLAIDTPGCKHASSSRLFACGSNIRLIHFLVCLLSIGWTPILRFCPAMRQVQKIERLRIAHAQELFLPYLLI